MLFLPPCDLDSCSSLFASWRPVIQLCCTVEAKPGLFMLKLYFCIFSIFPKLLWARTKIKKEMKMLGSRLTGCRLDVAKDWPPSFPFERQKEKKEWERERRYGKRRRRRSSPTPHFFFPLASSPSLPSLCPTFSLSLSFTLSFLWLFGRKWKVRGEQEVSFIHLACVLWSSERERRIGWSGELLVELYVGRLEYICICSLT